MPISDKNRIFDGWLGLEAGVDAGRQADMLDPNQAESAINMTFRGGDATTRPGFRKLEQRFSVPAKQLYVYESPLIAATGGWPPDPWDWYQPPAYIKVRGEYADGMADNPDMTESSEDAYLNGKFQCALAFSPHNGEDCIMALVGGRLFKIVPGGQPVRDAQGEIIVPSPLTAQVTEVKIEGETGDRDLRNMKDRPIAYMCQADKWLIAQDGISNAIIYDSAKARRAVTATDIDHTEVPCGTMMAYGMGRLVVIVNERDVAFGDLYGSHDLPDPADSLIFFTERNFLAEGFDAAIPFTQGVATGIVFFPQLDTSTGNGQLMVFAERGATSFFLSLPREVWKESQFQILSLLTTGLRGHRTIAVVNEDLWFRSDDGVRSYRQARSEPQGWAHIPQSTNVRQFLENDSEWLLKYASGIYFNNRAIFTTSPMWYKGRPMHWGMVVVDFDILSSFGETAKPAWEGQWTMSSSVFPVQLVSGTFNGVTRAFVFAIDNQNRNQIYELTTDERDDWDGQRINWELVSRKFDFNKLTPQASTPFTENELYGADIWLKDIVE